MSTVPSGQPGANKPTGSTKKQRRKAAQRRQLLTFGAIVVLVLVVAAAVWGVQRWMDSRPGPAPEDLRVTVEINGEEQEHARTRCASVSRANATRARRWTSHWIRTMRSR